MTAPIAIGDSGMHWDWIGEHVDKMTSLGIHHLKLSLLPILFGLIMAVPLGIACVRWRWLYPPALTGANILYAIPSLALFMIFIPYTGIGEGATEDFTVIIPLTVFSLSVLLPNVVDGLRSVPEPVRQAATAMGFGTLRRLIMVELPIAVPVVIAGTRVATVASISLASVGALVANGGLGELFSDGQNRDIPSEIVAGIVILALVADGLLVGLQWLLTPWSRARRGRSA